MKCPYSPSRKTVTQSNNSVNDEQTNGYAIVTQTETIEFGECHTRDCAAWDNNKGCKFNTSVE